MRGMSTADAAQRGLMFYIIIQVFALCWLPILGLILDRVDRVMGLAIAMLLAGLGYFSLFMLNDPLGPMMWVCAVLVGIGEMSANLGSLTLIGSEAPKKGRGAVIGLFSLCGCDWHSVRREVRRYFVVDVWRGCTVHAGGSRQWRSAGTGTAGLEIRSGA